MKRAAYAWGVVMVLVPAMAWAHPGHPGGGFFEGWVHPFSGLDHVLGMAAVGLWAARDRPGMRWRVPLAFLVGMLAGGIAGLAGHAPSWMESALAASVLAAAIIAMLALRMPVWIRLLLAVGFAALHGMAHGVELPAAADPAGYTAGFLLASAVLLMLGAWAGTRLQTGARDRWLAAFMGGLALTLF